jgi:tRNA1Val (adenine37-N6)-methyltransferase
VFFGAWAPVSGAGQVLDVGAGTGLLALMAAQRVPKAAGFVALEPNEEAFLICQQNFEASPWASQMEVLKTRIEDYKPDSLFSDILCNPPFFVESLPRQSPALTEALHADRGLLERWITLCLDLLAAGGRLHIMALPEARLGVLKLSQKLGFYINQEGFLYHSPAHPAMRWMACLGKQDSLTARRPNWYVHDENGQHDEAYKLLVKEFYLKF